MKILLNKIIQSQYFLALLGLAFLSYYTWFRFIRKILPKEIPFKPSLWSVLALLTICGLYAYLLLRLYKPKPPNPWVLYIIEKLYPIYRPLHILDRMFREGTYSKPYFKLFINYLGKALSYITNTEKSLYLYCIWYIIPRTMLLIVLMVDTFYFHKLNYIYSFAFLTLFILICYYIVYCIQLTIKQYIEYLDYYYIVEITSRDFQGSNYCLDLEDIRWDQISINYFRDIKYYESNDYSYDFDDKTEYYLKIQRFIDMQTTALWLNYTPYNYKCIPTWNVVEKYYNYEYRQTKCMWDLKAISHEDLRVLEKDFYDLLPTTVYLQLFIETYVSVSKKHRLINIIQIIITSLYLLTWLYILGVTLHSFPESSCIPIFLDTIEPFSGIIL